MKELLDKTRRINRLLQQIEGPLRFKDMSRVLQELIGCSVYVISTKGKLLGHASPGGRECSSIEERVIKPGRVPDDFNRRLLGIAETAANLQCKKGCCFGFEDCEGCARVMTNVPINGGGHRLGTLVLASEDRQLTDEDLILAEYGATVVGMEILRAESEEMKEESRQKAAVQIALGTLSYSEIEAVEKIFDELGGPEGLLVASKVADKAGITRSVIVNALRKLESAGVLESRSLGMKGTYIRVLNRFLLPEMDRLRTR